MSLFGPPGLIVRLDEAERRVGVGVGKMRDKDAKERGYQPVGGSEERDAVLANAVGALAECAAHKGANLFWSPRLGDPDAPDMGPFEVRGTFHADGGLLLRPRDERKIERAWICAQAQDWDEEHGWAHVFRLAGWAWGYEVMVPAHEKTRWPPSYWLMPQADLRDLRTLPIRLLDGWRGEWS